MILRNINSRFSFGPRLAAIAVISAASAFAQYSSPVKIVNTPAQSVPVRDQDHGARQPVYLYAVFNFVAGSQFAVGNGVSVYTVPIGKRLVLEFYSIELLVPIGQKARVTLQMGSSGGQVGADLTLPISSYDGGSPTVESAIGAGLMKAYVDPGSKVSFSVRKTETSGTAALGNVALTGYLVDIP
jgi:hypothetical protein